MQKNKQAIGLSELQGSHGFHEATVNKQQLGL